MCYSEASRGHILNEIIKTVTFKHFIIFDKFENLELMYKVKLNCPISPYQMEYARQLHFI